MNEPLNSQYANEIESFGVDNGISYDSEAEKAFEDVYNDHNETYENSSIDISDEQHTDLPNKESDVNITDDQSQYGLVQKLVSGFHSCRAEVQSLKCQLNHKDLLLQSLSTREHNLRLENDKLCCDMAKYEQDIMILETQIQNMADFEGQTPISPLNIDNIRGSLLNAANQKIKELTIQQSKMNNFLAELQLNKQNMVLKYETDIKTINEEMSHICDQLAQRTVLYSAHERRWNHSLRMNEDVNNQLQQELNQLKATSTSSHEQLTRLDEERINLKIENKQYQESTLLLKEQIHELTEKISHYNEEMQSLTTENISLQNIVHNLKNSDIYMTEKKLLEDMEQIKQESLYKEMQWKIQIEEIKTRLEQEMSQKESLYHTIQSLEGELHEKHETIQEFTMKYIHNPNNSILDHSSLQHLNTTNTTSSNIIIETIRKPSILHEISPQDLMHDSIYGENNTLQQQYETSFYNPNNISIVTTEKDDNHSLRDAMQSISMNTNMDKDDILNPSKKQEEEEKKMTAMTSTNEEDQKDMQSVSMLSEDYLIQYIPDESVLLPTAEEDHTMNISQWRDELKKAKDIIHVYQQRDIIWLTAVIQSMLSKEKLIHTVMKQRNKLNTILRQAATMSTMSTITGGPSTANMDMYEHQITILREEVEKYQFMIETYEKEKNDNYEDVSKLHVHISDMTDQLLKLETRHLSVENTLYELHHKYEETCQDYTSRCMYLERYSMISEDDRSQQLHMYEKLFEVANSFRDKNVENEKMIQVLEKRIEELLLKYDQIKNDVTAIDSTSLLLEEQSTQDDAHDDDDDADDEYMCTPLSPDDIHIPIEGVSDEINETLENAIHGGIDISTKGTVQLHVHLEELDSSPEELGLTDLPSSQFIIKSDDTLDGSQHEVVKLENENSYDNIVVREDVLNESLFPNIPSHSVEPVDSLLDMTTTTNAMERVDGDREEEDVVVDDDTKMPIHIVDHNQNPDKNTLLYTLHDINTIKETLKQKYSKKKESLKIKYKSAITQLQDYMREQKEIEIAQWEQKYNTLVQDMNSVSYGVKVHMDEENLINDIVLYPEMLSPAITIELVKHILSRFVSDEDIQTLLAFRQ